MWRWEDVKMRRCERRYEDEKVWRCEDEQMWRWEDVKTSRCEDEQMWRWADVKMRRCEDENEKMCRWADVKMSRCEDEQMWRWEGVKMRRCEDKKMWRWEGVREGVKMRRWEDEKMRYRPPLLEEPCAQTLSGKNYGKSPCSMGKSTISMAISIANCNKLRGGRDARISFFFPPLRAGTRRTKTNSQRWVYGDFKGVSEVLWNVPCADSEWARICNWDRLRNWSW